MSAPTPNPIPKRRRWRFGTRTLLLVIALLAGWLAWYVHRAERQRNVVRWVEANGGAVHYDYQVDANGVYQVNQPKTPSWLIDQLGIDYFATVVSVDLRYVPEDISSIVKLRRDDEFVPRIETAPRFPNDKIGHAKDFEAYFPPGSFSDPENKLPSRRKNADFEETKASDMAVGRGPITGGVSQFGPLATLNGLKFLYLSHTDVVDLNPISDLKRLEILNLSGTAVTDLEPLRDHRRLRRLDFWATQVSDVSPLLTLRNLESVNLRRTTVKENDLDGLKRAMPDCKIID